MTTSLETGRVLCFDYGRKRIGVAVSDRERLLATPLPLLLNRPPQLWQEVHSLFGSYHITEVLFGYPSTADGSKISLHYEMENFLGFLKNRYPRMALKIIDEAYSSLQAEQLLHTLQSRSHTSLQQRKKNKQKLDSTAAAILLSQYLQDPALGIFWYKPLE